MSATSPTCATACRFTTPAALSSQSQTQLPFSFFSPQAVAAHAGRSAIEPADVAVAFKRQRLTSGTKSLADLLHAQLPMECVDALVPKARAVAK